MEWKPFGLLFGAVVGGIAPAGHLIAQQQEQQKEERTERAGGAAESETGSRSVASWIRDLGAASYKRRVAAEQALREIGPDALETLRKAAQDSGDAEIQWRSKRLVRQIESAERRAQDPVEGSGQDPVRGAEERRPGQAGPDRIRTRGEIGGLPSWPWASGRGPDVRTQFEDMFQRLERDFGIDVPQRRFFHDNFFRDIDQQFRDLQDLQGRMQGLQGLSQGMNMQVGPDGVRVEVKEQNEDGEVETKVYEAPDLETFKTQYPDVLKNNGLLFGGGQPFTFRSFRAPSIDLDDPFAQVDPFRGVNPFGNGQQPWRNPPGISDPRGQVAPPGDGERLGIRIRDELPVALRRYLGLEDGVGLMVQDVQSDTLADELGLQANDIITAIGDTPIGSPADVRRSLRAIPKGDVVEVAWVRRGREMRGTVKKHHDAPPIDNVDSGRVEVDGGRSESRRPELQKGKQQQGEFQQGDLKKAPQKSKIR